MCALPGNEMQIRPFIWRSPSRSHTAPVHYSPKTFAVNAKKEQQRTGTEQYLWRFLASYICGDIYKECFLSSISVSHEANPSRYLISCVRLVFTRGMTFILH